MDNFNSSYIFLDDTIQEASSLPTYVILLEPCYLGILSRYWTLQALKLRTQSK